MIFLSGKRDVRQLKLGKQHGQHMHAVFLVCLFMCTLFEDCLNFQSLPESIYSPTAIPCPKKSYYRLAKFSIETI